MSTNPTPPVADTLWAVLGRQANERAALLDSFEVEVRNETVGPFLRPSLAVTKELHGGCAALTSHPFTVVFVSGNTLCAIPERRDSGIGMNFLGRNPTVLGFTPEDAKRMLEHGRAHLTKSKADMECQIWSTDALGLYIELHKRHLAEAEPLIAADLVGFRHSKTEGHNS